MGKTQFIAFLRAINVGGHLVKMTELKGIFANAGLEDVSTFIASGNVGFTSGKSAAALEKQIEVTLQKSLGYVVATMLRTTGEVAAVATHQAFPVKALGGASLYVGFMRETAAADAISKALALQTKIDELHVHGREIYWLARKNISEATITAAAVEKALRTPVTFRNINTVRRLAARYP